MLIVTILRQIKLSHTQNLPYIYMQLKLQNALAVIKLQLGTQIYGIKTNTIVWYY